VRPGSVVVLGLDADAREVHKFSRVPNPVDLREHRISAPHGRLDHEHTAFTFLGFTFRARGARGKNGRNFTGFLPAVSKDALTRMSREVRRWRLHLRTGHTLAELARKINPTVRGWMQYYGAFYRTAPDPLLRRINAYLLRYLRVKYRRLRPLTKALACWQRITRQQPRLFAHWAWAASPLLIKTARAG